MGPFPHDAPPAGISDANPMGTDGMEFVEYAHPEPQKLKALFATMGFAEVARHRSKDVHAVAAGRRQLRGQRRAGFVRAALRGAARAMRLRHGVPRGRCEARL